MFNNIGYKVRHTHLLENVKVNRDIVVANLSRGFSMVGGSVQESAVAVDSKAGV